MEQTKKTNWQRAPAAKEQPMTGYLTTPEKKPERVTKVSTVTTTVSPKVSPKVSSAVSSKKETAASQGATGVGSLNINGIKLDAEMARSAIIMAEIIGPPKAKRRRGR